VKKLADQYHRSTAEVVLSWALSRNMSIIPRSSKQEHIHQLARLLDPNNRYFLSESDLIQIDQLEGIV
jgi:diketogulonate reductase-like aldo/keto reductase